MGAGFSKVRWRRGSGSFGRLKHLPSPRLVSPTRKGSLRPRLPTLSTSPSQSTRSKREEDNAEGRGEILFRTNVPQLEAP